MDAHLEDVFASFRARDEPVVEIGQHFESEQLR